ncbi:L-idonate 5-dehydrogenase [Cellulomonas aerilata]|uniref:L-idonate 5-dehydrogenase n=1 Tax=Cellulomonas aerilata TaxID=515326 RepID=A0A512DF40_9CELL|nr:L-idonate 5-dehydrogenase [Cellulomonas aerilata]GEO35104.1 L-idonate 5-dehydrogenase [Cellulomonas aerilata]
MRTVVIHGKDDLRIDEVPTPEPQDGQVRLRIAYVGICGSDLHYFFDGANGAFVVREPLVPGHELSGTVDLDPSGDLAAGTPVTVHPATFGTPVEGLEGSRQLWPGGSYLGSASTWPHTQGGMSEYLVVRREMVRVLPADLPLRRAALAEPLAVALHGIEVVGGVQGSDVLVSGSGPIGLLATFAAAVQGARSVTATDTLPGPLARATALGATATLRVGRDDVPANAFDVALECTGVPAAISATIRAVRPRGRISQVGMLPGGAQPVELASYISKEITMHGSFRFDDEIDRAIRLLAEHPEVEAALTHEIPAGSAEQAFSLARDSEASGKVLVSLWADGTPA